jgi:cold shock CspA family protein
MFDHQLDRRLRGLQPLSAPPRRSKYSERISKMGVHQVVRHFGFVASDAPTLAGGHDLFVAGAMLQRCGLNGLKKGDRVTFDVVESRKHPGKFEAVNVALLVAAEAA